MAPKLFRGGTRTRRGGSSSLNCKPSRSARIPVAARAAYQLAVTLALAFVVSVAPLGSTAQRISTSQKLDAALDELRTRGSGQGDVRVIIRAREADASDRLKSRLRAHGDRIEADHASLNSFTATVHVADLGGLADDPATEGISIDAVVRPHQGWTNTLLGTELLPDPKGATGTNTRVAIIDSGLELTNDLALNRVLGFYDLTRNDQVVPSSPYDDYGHGTHVAGLIAGNGSNSKGLYVGIAPDAKVLALKVLDKNGSGYTSDVIQAIEFILANQNSFHIDIINLSLGHPVFESATTDPLVLEVQKATQAGIIVVVAAGNYGQNPTTGLPGYGGITSPGNAPSAITVGAVDTQDTIGRGDDSIPVYSSRGPTWYDGYAKPDLVAPGHRLVSVAALKSTLYQQYSDLRVVGKTGDIARYFRLSGSSMATAVTSGAVALMLDAAGKNKEFFTPNLVKALLEWSAIPIAGYDTLTQGNGSLNVSGALALIRKINPPVPVGAYWLTSNVTPSTTIGGLSWPWAQTVIWGNTTGYGNLIDTKQTAWDQTVIWGNTVVWGNTVIWGNNVVWSSPTVWSSTVIWGNTFIATTGGTTVIWGNVTPSTVIWGNLATAFGANADSTFADIQQ